MRYKADLTAGSLKITESRAIASLLLLNASESEWKECLFRENILQTMSPASTVRLARLIRDRLETMGPELWQLVRDGDAQVATHATLAAAVKHSALLGDFLDLALREQYRLHRQVLANDVWDDYLDGCRARDPEMPQWKETTLRRLRSSVFQIMAQAGYIESTRSRKLQKMRPAPDVLQFLLQHDEKYVLRCLEVAS